MPKKKLYKYKVKLITILFIFRKDKLMNTPPSPHAQSTNFPVHGYVLLIATTMILFFLIAGPIYGFRSSVKKIAKSSQNRDLYNIAEEHGYKALPILDKYVDYIQELKAQLEELNAERERLSMDIQNQTSTLELLSQDQNIPSSQNSAEALFTSLFTGEINGSIEGIICKNEDDDTISCLTYVPRSEAFQPGASPAWEQYNRLEVDMYKRTGDWSGNIHQIISAVLPEELEGGDYRVCVFLRTDANRMGNGQQAVPSNGGTVKLLVREGTVSSGSLRLQNMIKGEDQVLEVHGGDTITLDISPQDHTHFFSYAICANKDVSQGEGDTRDVQN